MQTTGFAVTKYGFVSIREGKNFREVSINSYELEFYTEEFPGGSWVDGAFRPARKQYYSLCRPGQRQKLVPPYRCYYLNFSTVDPELCDYLDRLAPTDFVWEMDTVVELLREMVQIQDRGTPQGKLWLDSCVSRILSILGRNQQGEQPMLRGVLRHRETLMMVDRYIREHLEEDLSLERLGALSNLEPTYLQKLYASAYGQTPARRALALRISAARVALIEGDEPVGEIAARLGFSSQAYFTSIFKKVIHCTPTAFRARQRKRDDQ